MSLLHLENLVFVFGKAAFQYVLLKCCSIGFQTCLLIVCAYYELIPLRCSSVVLEGAFNWSRDDCPTK